MSVYRFGGTHTMVGGLILSRFGQSAEFNDKLASEVILGGGCIVPASDPVWKEFTEQEMSLYANPQAHSQANDAFLAKKKKVLLACHSIRERLASGGALNPAANPTPASPAPSTSVAA